MTPLIKKYWKKAENILSLSVQFAKAEFKLRNEGSYLGILWYLLNPLLTFAILLVIFLDRLGSDIKYYPLYLLLGVIMFNFFQSTILEATKSITKEHHLLIKSTNFPREALIISIVLQNLFSHLFEVALFMLFLIFYKINLLCMVYYLPILILFLLFTLGASLVLSSLTVYFVDLDNICNFAVRIIWLGTPIFYSIGGQTRLFYFNLLNPIYYFITMARDSIIYNQMPQWWVVSGTALFTLLAVVVGFFIFERLKGKFAEMI